MKKDNNSNRSCDLYAIISYGLLALLVCSWILVALIVECSTKYSFQVKSDTSETLLSVSDCRNLKVNDDIVQYEKDGHRYTYHIPKEKVVNIQKDAMIQLAPTAGSVIYCGLFFATLIAFAFVVYRARNK